MSKHTLVRHSSNKKQLIKKLSANVYFRTFRKYEYYCIFQGRQPKHTILFTSLHNHTTLQQSDLYWMQHRLPARTHTD